MDSPLVLRTAAPADAAAMLEIYAPYVRTTAITFEYEVPSPETFAARIEQTLPRYPWIAAERKGKLIGYAYAGAFHAREAYAWAAEVSVYVRQGARRTGVGSALYDGLELALQMQGVLNVCACIAYPPQDDPYLTRDSAVFHARQGFLPAAHFHRCGYKFSRWYDMIWMEKELGEHLSKQPPVQPFGAVAAAWQKAQREDRSSP